MKKLRVLFDPKQPYGVELQAIEEFDLQPSEADPNLYTLGEHRRVQLPTGDEFEVMCELTSFGNYFSVYEKGKRHLGLKVRSQFNVALRLSSGTEVSFDVVDRS